MISLNLKFNINEEGLYKHIEYIVYEQDSVKHDQYNQSSRLEKQFASVLTSLLSKHEIGWTEEKIRRGHKITISRESVELIGEFYSILHHVSDSTKWVQQIIDDLGRKHSIVFEEKFQREDWPRFLDLISSISKIKIPRIKRFKDLYD
jgi:hypothetical protein